MKFKVEINEAKNPEDLSDKELMSLYKKYKNQNKNKEAESLIAEIDKRGLAESDKEVEEDLKNFIKKAKKVGNKVKKHASSINKVTSHIIKHL